MHQIYSIVLFIFAMSVSSYAQISIDKFNLPKAGTTLKYSASSNLDVDLGSAGANKTWDFSSLTKDNNIEVEFLNVSEGSIAVPNATMLTKSGNGNVEQYYSNTDLGLEEIFIKTKDPLTNSIEIERSYNKNPLYRRNTIYYGQNFQTESKFGMPIAWKDLPDTITSGIGLQLDSVRFNQVSKTSSEVDAYGVVKLPDADWDVLREKSVTERKLTVDIHFLGTWIEAPKELLEGLSGQFAAFLKPDTSHTVVFYSDKAVEQIARFRTNIKTGAIEAAFFKNGAAITQTENFISKKEQDVNCYPNPSFGDVNFKFENCSPGKYTVQVYSILGRKMWEKSYYLNPHKKSLPADLSALKKGTYLYSVFNPQGKKITTKRLIILNP